MIECITLDVALMCFKSDFLEKRIQGLKMLQEITKQIKLSKTIKHLTIEYMVSYLNVFSRLIIFLKIKRLSG